MKTWGGSPSQQRRGVVSLAWNPAGSHGNITMVLTWLTVSELYLKVKITSNLSQNWQKKFFKKGVLVTP